MQAVRIKFGIIVVSVNGQIINLDVKRGEPYHNKGITVADRFKVGFTQKLAVGDRIEINFDPRGEIKNFDLDTDEFEQYLCYEIDDSFFSLEVGIVDDDTVGVENVLVVPNPDGRLQKIIIKVVDENWRRIIHDEVGVAWHLNEHPGNEKYEMQLAACVDFACL